MFSGPCQLRRQQHCFVCVPGPSPRHLAAPTLVRRLIDADGPIASGRTRDAKITGEKTVIVRENPFLHSLENTAKKADTQPERLVSVSEPPAVPCFVPSSLLCTSLYRCALKSNNLYRHFYTQITFQFATISPSVSTSLPHTNRILLTPKLTAGWLLRTSV